jgi:hypothetical protein
MMPRTARKLSLVKFDPSRLPRMTGMKTSDSAISPGLSCLFAMCFLAWIATGCGQVAPSAVVGSYVRTASGVKETLLLKQDGTFNQVVEDASGKTFTLTDSWTNEYKRVCFHRFYFTFEVATGKLIQPPALRSMAYLRWEKDVLVVNADIEDRIYLFHKQPEPKGE